MKQNGQNIMFLQPPLISYIWNAARDTKLQYLRGLRRFKATGQSLGNLKPALQVRHYLMYTVCPIAGSYRDLVFDMKLFLVRQTSARAHERSGHPFLGKRIPLSAPSEATRTTKQIKTEIYHEKSFDVLIATIKMNRLASAYGKVICNFYTFNDRSPPISMSRRCIFIFFIAILTFGPAVGKLATKPPKI